MPGPTEAVSAEESSLAGKIAGLVDDTLSIGADIDPDAPEREDEDASAEEDGEAQEAVAEPKEGEDDEQETEASAEDGEDRFIEIPGEEGADPEKIPVDEAIAAYRERQQFEGRQQQILSEVQYRAQTQAAQFIDTQRQAAAQAIQTMTTWLSALPMPQAPPADWINPNSQNYNPEQYHYARAQYDAAMGAINQVRNQLTMAQQHEARLAEQQDAAKSESEYAVLQNVWPELRDPAKAAELAEGIARDAYRFYKVSPDELDGLGDHRGMLIVRDALAYRRMQEKGGTITQRAKVKTAPKAVPATGRSAQPRDAATGQYTQARNALKKSGRLDRSEAVAIFSKFA